VNINFISQAQAPAFVNQGRSMQIAPISPMAESNFVPMPVGKKEGDIAYWDPEVGDSGAWIILEAPDPDPENPKNLTFREKLIWSAGLPRGATKGDILYWDPLAGDDGAWVVLAAPLGSGLKVLTISGDNLAWIDTQDCP
jgi:hypothetical protein